jgi:hypothetical protein
MVVNRNLQVRKQTAYGPIHLEQKGFTVLPIKDAATETLRVTCPPSGLLRAEMK